MAILSGGTDLYSIFATAGGGSISGSGTAGYIPQFSSSSVLTDSLASQSSNRIDINGILYPSVGIRFPDQSDIFVMKRVSIGDWDMDTDSNKSVAHGLSATEWKTIIDIKVIIRNDADDTYYDLYNLEGFFLGTGSIDYFDSTNIELFRGSSSVFNDTAFNATSYNRGYVSFWYIPD